MATIGPSGVRALPFAAGINEGGLYFRYFGSSVLRVPAEQLRWPLFLVIGLSVLRAPAEQTKVATVFGN